MGQLILLLEADPITGLDPGAWAEGGITVITNLLTSMGPSIFKLLAMVLAVGLFVALLRKVTS